MKRDEAILDLLMKESGIEEAVWFVMAVAEIYVACFEKDSVWG